MLYLTGMFSHLFNDFFSPRKTYSVIFCQSQCRAANACRTVRAALGRARASRRHSGPQHSRQAREAGPASTAPALPSPQPEGRHDEQAQGSSKSLKTEEHKKITPMIMFKRSILLPWLICTTKRVIKGYSCHCYGTLH